MHWLQRLCRGFIAVAQVVPLLRKCSLAGHAEFKTRDEVCLLPYRAAALFLDLQECFHDIELVLGLPAARPRLPPVTWMTLWSRLHRTHSCSSITWSHSQDPAA